MVSVNTLSGIPIMGGLQEDNSLYGSDFVMGITTTGAAETVTIPCRDEGTFNATIDWGDETESTITTYDDADLAHEYADAGDYIIRISGTFPNISFDDAASADAVTSILQLGDMGWVSLRGGFHGCSNLVSFTAGVTDGSNINDMRCLFQNCTSLTSVNLSALSGAACLNNSAMFRGASSLVTVVFGSFDTSQSTTMRFMFEGCSALTSAGIANFDTSSCTDMGSMFAACTSYVSLDVSHFDTSATTKMNSMFNGMTSLTSLDVSGDFDTSACADFSYMFADSAALTDIVGIDDFDLSAVNGTSDLIEWCRNITLPIARYSALLEKFADQSVLSNLTGVDFHDSTYYDRPVTMAAKAALVDDDGWTITDGGPVFVGDTISGGAADTDHSATDIYTGGNASTDHSATDTIYAGSAN